MVIVEKSKLVEIFMKSDNFCGEFTQRQISEKSSFIFKTNYWL